MLTNSTHPFYFRFVLSYGEHKSCSDRLFMERAESPSQTGNGQFIVLTPANQQYQYFFPFLMLNIKAEKTLKQLLISRKSDQSLKQLKTITRKNNVVFCSTWSKTIDISIRHKNTKIIILRKILGSLELWSSC